MANEDNFHIGIKILISNEENRILLLRSNKEHTGKDYWDIPGGRIKYGDTVEETLNREVEEETGLDVSTHEFAFLGSHLTSVRIPIGDHNVGLVFFIYKCPWNSTPQIRLSEEHIDYKWVTKAEAAEVMGTRFPGQIITENF